MVLLISDVIPAVADPTFDFPSWVAFFELGVLDGGNSKDVSYKHLLV